jgi:YD repeat-containing protein
MPGVTPRNLPALFKRLPLAVFIAALAAGGSLLPAQGNPPSEEGRQTRWYRSNASGMTLEPVPSRIAALRNEYCLSIDRALARNLPEILSPHYENSFEIEARTLYENGAEIRRQWVFRDGAGFVRLVSSGSGRFLNDRLPGEARTGFIEIRDREGLLTREFRFEEDLSEWDFRFFYNEKTLISAETWFKAPPGALPGRIDGEPAFVPVSTDYYRYSRSGSLRAIDRTVHEGAGEKTRLGFPRPGTGTVPAEELPVTNDIAYASAFLRNIDSPDGVKISYTLDSRGRVLGEIWRDADGNVIGEFRNTWSGDRLSSVLWKSKDDERLVEYEYDAAGNRIAERNYKQGELERITRSSGDRETEEIYMNGRLALRAIWEKGMKISEEWIMSGGNNR